MTSISDLLNRWNSDEGKPYKGCLIDMAAYTAAPDSIGCMCAQGQVLHLLAGWTPDRLSSENQAVADAETAKLLNISRAHAVLLRIVNDKADGAPSVVLTDPSKVLGDKWSTFLDFWRHLDGMTKEQWDAAWDAARAAVRDAARAAARDAARAAVGDAARDAAEAAAWDAAGASNEIQGSDILRQSGAPLFFLRAFGFARPDDIPARPADYGIYKGEVSS